MVISGPGIGLPLAQNLYPTSLQNAPQDWSNNTITLSGGESIVIPSGDFWISLGMYTVLQYLDPVSGTWQTSSSASYNRGTHYVIGDGFNVRIANMTGCPVGAVVAALGSGYVQSTTTVVQTPGNGTWVPIVGGSMAMLPTTLLNNGAGYGVAPLTLIAAPPPPSSNANGVGGIPAAGYCTIASGTVSGFTFTSPGAGYPTAPVPIIVPSPFDPNLTTGITTASMTFSLTNSGALTGAFCTNSGAPLANPANITLTVAGAGSSGSLSAVVMQTVTAGTVSGPGVGYGTGANAIMTIGGVPPQGSIAGPYSLYLAWLPRPAQISLTGSNTSVSVGTAGVIYDGGLFEGTPTGIWVAGATGALPTTVGTIALTMGTIRDQVLIQPAG